MVSFNFRNLGGEARYGKLTAEVGVLEEVRMDGDFAD